MNMKLIVRLLLFGSSVALFAAPTQTVLLIGKAFRDSGGTVATGEARAVIKDSGEQLVVTADEISLATRNTHLTAVGNVTITAGLRVIRGPELTIDLETGVTVYMLNPNGVILENRNRLQMNAPSSFEPRTKLTDAKTEPSPAAAVKP